MDLFDNYFRTLKLFLPSDQREDIVRELSEEVQSQVAEKEAALGRALNASEQEALLRQFGHPLLTASRYRPRRYLVGPILFPYYWLLLKVVVGLIVLTHLIGAVVIVAEGSSPAQLELIGEHMISNVLKALRLDHAARFGRRALAHAVASSRKLDALALRRLQSAM